MSTERAVTAQRSVRVVSMYATRWKDAGKGPPPTKLDLEPRLARHYDHYQDRLPRRLLHRPATNVAEVRFSKQQPDVTLTSAEVSLFALPSNQIVCEVTLTIDTDPFSVETVKAGVAGVLERCIEGDLQVQGKSLAKYVDNLAEEVKAESIPSEAEDLLLERHLLVFVPRSDEDEGPPGQPVIDEIVYRDAPPYREEFTKLQSAQQLNQEGRTLGAVNQYVSLLYGHEKFVEDSVFISTVQALGTASRFRQIWHEAYREVQHFRTEKQSQGFGKQTREDLERLADNLGNLEFDLAFSVEFPLIRIESFHSALFDALDLTEQTRTLSRMFAQLSGSVRSEITAIEIRERRRDLYRQKWNAAAASVISFLAFPISFVVAFFGINATQVSSQYSMFDYHHYWWVYIIGFLLATVPAILIIRPYFYYRKQRSFMSRLLLAAWRRAITGGRTA
jgi:hypothetical protein